MERSAVRRIPVGEDGPARHARGDGRGSVRTVGAHRSEGVGCRAHRGLQHDLRDAVAYRCPHGGAGQRHGRARARFRRYQQHLRRPSLRGRHPRGHRARRGDRGLRPRRAARLHRGVRDRDVHRARRALPPLPKGLASHLDPGGFRSGRGVRETVGPRPRANRHCAGDRGLVRERDQGQLRRGYEAFTSATRPATGYSRRSWRATASPPRTQSSNMRTGS